MGPGTFDGRFSWSNYGPRMRADGYLTRFGSRPWRVILIANEKSCGYGPSERCLVAAAVSAL